VLACWYTSWDGAYHSKFGTEYEQRELLRDIAQADFVIAQNAKFELGWLDRCGLDLHDVLVWDTMLAEWVVAGNRQFPKDLGSMLKKRSLAGKEDVVGGMIKLGICPSNIPKGLLNAYCREDVRGTLELFRCQIQELEERQQLHLVLARCLLTPVLADIEKQGIVLDKDAVYEEYHRVIQEKDDTERLLSEFGQINWNSRQQVAELLYDQLGFDELRDRRGNVIRTAAGARSTSRATLSQLRGKTATQRAFLEAFAKLALLNTKISKTLAFFKEICDNHECKFHGAFNQGSTGTHRLSSSGRKIETDQGDSLSAQLQNIPREYKKFIRARDEGWEVCEADGSQIEFRVAADLGHDEVAYDEICRDADIHTATATVFLEDGTHPDFKGLDLKQARQPAKPQTFKPLYGGRGNHPAEKVYCEFFQDKYKGIYSTQTQWTYDVLRDKELRTPYGLIFYWPDTQLTRSGYITNSTSIFNYPIQGFATAEIIPIVLVSLWRKLRGWDVRIILTVHDSIILEVGPSVDRRQLYDLIARAFTEDVYKFLERVYGYRFTVPLGAEIKMGPVWGSGKGQKVKMFPNEGELVWQ